MVVSLSEMCNLTARYFIDVCDHRSYLLSVGSVPNVGVCVAGWGWGSEFFFIVREDKRSSNDGFKGLPLYHWSHVVFLSQMCPSVFPMLVCECLIDLCTFM